MNPSIFRAQGRGCDGTEGLEMPTCTSLQAVLGRYKELLEVCWWHSSISPHINTFPTVAPSLITPILSFPAGLRRIRRPTITMKLSIPSALLVARWVSRATADIPAVCYNTCSDAFLEGQREGWSNQLCQPGSPFLDLKWNCWMCCYNHNFSGMEFEGTYFEEVTKWC